MIQRRRSESDLADAERAAGEAGTDLGARIASLERRFEHLESQLEALQDSIHREGVRHKREIQGLKTGFVQRLRSLGAKPDEREG